MGVSEVVFEVAGARRGKTFLFKGRQFVDGRTAVLVDKHSLAPVASYLASTVQAYPVGSPELEAAKKKHGWTEKKVVKNGNSETDSPPAGGKTAEVPGGVPPISKPPASPEAGKQQPDAGADSGKEGVLSGGSGQKDGSSVQKPAVTKKGSQKAAENSDNEF